MSLYNATYDCSKTNKTLWLFYEVTFCILVQILIAYNQLIKNSRDLSQILDPQWPVSHALDENRRNSSIWIKIIQKGNMVGYWKIVILGYNLSLTHILYSYIVARIHRTIWGWSQTIVSHTEKKWFCLWSLSFDLGKVY